MVDDDDGDDSGTRGGVREQKLYQLPTDGSFPSPCCNARFFSDLKLGPVRAQLLPRSHWTPSYFPKTLCILMDNLQSIRGRRELDLLALTGPPLGLKTIVPFDDHIFTASGVREREERSSLRHLCGQLHQSQKHLAFLPLD